jgi:hypothetical protein
MKVSELPALCGKSFPRRLSPTWMFAVALVLVSVGQAYGRQLQSEITTMDAIPNVHPEYQVPSEPNQLFYIQRSSNSNTVVYAARLDSHGRIDPENPVDAYWRWYNVDGHKKPLNFIEKMMAYGVKSVAHDGPNGSYTFKVAALPERKLTLDEDRHGHPEALMQIGGRAVKLVYVYLQVDNSGLMPSVTALDIFGVDKLTGKAVREHVIPH